MSWGVLFVSVIERMRRYTRWCVCGHACTSSRTTVCVSVGIHRFSEGYRHVSFLSRRQLFRRKHCALRAVLGCGRVYKGCVWVCCEIWAVALPTHTSSTFSVGRGLRCAGRLLVSLYILSTIPRGTTCHIL